jgi:RHS repeat-associated protein
MVMPNTPTPVLFGGTGMQNLGTDAAPVAVLTSGGYYWIAADWQSTPHIIQNISKVTAWTYDRLAFGDNAPNQNPAGLGTFVYNPRFPGQYADSESATAWNGARIYGPSTGRYLQSDPLGLSGSILGTLSTFPYVGSNPMTSTDPMGQQTMGQSAPGLPWQYIIPVIIVGWICDQIDHGNVIPFPTATPTSANDNAPPVPLGMDPKPQSNCPFVRMLPPSASIPGNVSCIYQCESGLRELEFAKGVADRFCPPSIMPWQGAPWSPVSSGR